VKLVELSEIRREYLKEKVNDETDIKISEACIQA
jgi:hypothetical protein